MKAVTGALPRRRRSQLAVVALTVLTLVAFAANSIFNRLALASRSIDPASFAAVRLLAGAAMLALLQWLRRGPRTADAGASWGSATALFGYAAAFSFAYLTLDAGVGALVLFAAVQATMILVGIRSGERPSFAQWSGLGLALGGLAWLAAPGVSAPSPLGLTLMAIAGVAWGIYSLRGRSSSDPTAATAGNFARAVPLALVPAGALLALGNAVVSGAGVLWAVLSGALTSGLGYVMWYAVVREMTATRAAIVQLAVPVLAAIAGIALLGEVLTLRLVVASAAIVGGVALATLSRERQPAA